MCNNLVAGSSTILAYSTRSQKTKKIDSRFTLIAPVSEKQTLHVLYKAVL